MGEPTMAERVEKLEKSVESLAALPGEVRAIGRRLVRVELRTGAVESQIVHLRSDMRGEFSAVRDQLAQAKADLLEVIDSSSQATQVMFDDMSKRFDGVDQRLDGVDRRFDGVDQRFDGIDQRFDGIDQRFDGVDRRLDGVDQRLDGVDQRLAGLDQRLGAVEKQLRGVEDAVAGMASAAEMRKLHGELVRQIASLGSGRELS